MSFYYKRKYKENFYKNYRKTYNFFFFFLILRQNSYEKIVMIKSVQTVFYIPIF